MLTDQPLEQHRQIVDMLGHFKHLRAQRLPTREGQKLAHQARSAVGALLDRHDVAKRGIGRFVLEQQQVRKSDDRRQHVVEIMGHPTGQLPHRLHFHALCKLFFELALLGHVERIKDRRLVAFPALLDARNEHAHAARLFSRNRRIDRRDFRPVPLGIGQRHRQFFPAFRIDQRGDIEPLDPAFPRCQPENPGKGRIGTHHLARPVERRNGNRGVVEKPRKAHFGGPQCLFPLDAA